MSNNPSNRLITHRRKIKFIDTILIAIFSALVFIYIVLPGDNDVYAHILHATKICAGEMAYPANFLFYYLLNFLSFFNCSVDFKLIIAISILSISSAYKYHITKRCLSHASNQNQYKKINLITIFALGMFFCFALPNPYSVFVSHYLYFGNFVPVVWHNSTTIFLFPFCLLLYFKQLDVFESPKTVSVRDTLMLSILVVVNLAIKPSFIFVYLPVTFCFILANYKADGYRKGLLNLLPIFFGALLLIIQYLLIYIEGQGSIQKEPSRIALTLPLEVFTFFNPLWYFPIALISSYAFPIAGIFLFGKEIFGYKPFIYAFYMTIVAILIFAFLKETGPRLHDGNFYWQIVISTYLLHLSTVLFLVKNKIKSNVKFENKVKIMLGLFLFHSFSGVLFLIKYKITFFYG